MTTFLATKMFFCVLAMKLLQLVADQAIPLFAYFFTRWPRPIDERRFIESVAGKMADVFLGIGAL